MKLSSHILVSKWTAIEHEWPRDTKDLVRCIRKCERLVVTRWRIKTKKKRLDDLTFANTTASLRAHWTETTIFRSFFCVCVQFDFMEGKTNETFRLRANRIFQRLIPAMVWCYILSFSVILLSLPLFFLSLWALTLLMYCSVSSIKTQMSAEIKKGWTLKQQRNNRKTEKTYKSRLENIVFTCMGAMNHTL